MKRLFLVLTVLMALSSLEVYSQIVCPPGYSYSNTTTIVYSTTCTLTVSYCISDVIPSGMNHRSIHITDFEWSSDDCIQGWMQDVNGDYIPEFPDYEQLIAIIVMENPIVYDQLELDICVENAPHEENTYLVVTDGGCYRTVNLFPEGAKVIPCDVYGVSKCHEYYTLCLELVDGSYVIRAKAGDPAPVFGCPQVPKICHPSCPGL